jgi:putative ABC transport system ATP-binding protein
MANPIVLQTESLTKSFTVGGRTLTVLDGVNLSVSRGEACAIFGPSGSGKTTLLSLCAGLDRPTAGTVRLDGASLPDLSEDERARLRRTHIGFVFQNFGLLPTLTALENVMVPAELTGQDGAEADARELLRRVGLEARADHYPVQLSGGEQQRVAIARAFINRPRLLFADEPTGNLDPDTAEPICQLLFDLNRSAQTTLLLITHDEELARRCRRRIRLRAGRVVEDTGAP